MPKLTVPEGVVAFAIEGVQFDVDDGVIDVTDATPHAVNSLINEYGCRPMTEKAEEDAAALALARAEEKKALLAKLAEAGVVVDGRASLTRLRQAVADLPLKK